MEKQKITKKDFISLRNKYVDDYLSELEEGFTKHNEKFDPLLRMNETLTVLSVATIILKDLFIIEG